MVIDMAQSAPALRTPPCASALPPQIRSDVGERSEWDERPPSRILRRGRHRRLRAGLVLAAREAVSKCVNERISIGRGRLESDNEQLLTDNRERCSWACAKSEDCPFFSPVVQT